MNKEQSYSVSQLSQKAGVSVRTLHYYDKIGLLKPQIRNDKGYRFYGYRQLVLLQQILIYRELDFSLEEISSLLNADNYDLLDALESQRLLLLERQTNTQSMIKSIEATMASLKTKQYGDIFFEDFPKEKAEQIRNKANEYFPDEVKNKYSEWLSTFSQDEVREMKAHSDRFNEAYIAVMHLPVEAPEVQALAKSHYELMCDQMASMYDNFDGINYPMFIKIADQLQSNEFFRDIYETAQEGMTDHLHKALLVFAETNLR